MRLQKMECPNCGSPLKTEGDMQVCNSCGGSFRIDYDDSDVAYERLSKEEELNRQKYAHEKDMLETEYRLQEEARLRRVRQDLDRERKKKMTSSVIMIIIVASFLGFGLLMYLLVWAQVKTKGDFNFGEETTETTRSPYLISLEDVTSDEAFMANAEDSILATVNTNRSGREITTYDLPVTHWNLITEPEIYECYLMVSETENRLCFLVKMSYQSNRDENDIKEIYDCLYLKNLTVGGNGRIVCDYSVMTDRGEGATDWAWEASLDQGQLYRSAILAKDGQFTVDEVVLFGERAPAESAAEPSAES